MWVYELVNNSKKSEVYNDWCGLTVSKNNKNGWKMIEVVLGVNQ